jgi:peptidoglycan/xylan/chitin deacetylase (PgdA/CDA1 family)
MKSPSLMLLAVLVGCASPPPKVPEVSPEKRPWTYVEDAPVRGDVSKKQIALIFTGGDHGEGAPHILDALSDRNIKAGFFLTGGFLGNPDLQPHVRRMIAEGHYVGPHSDAHLLYAPWEDRSKSIVTEQEFKADLQKNIDDLRKRGALKDRSKVVYFIPPFEWYNAEQTRWSREMGVLLFNFTPGSGSNRDFAPEGHKSFVPAAQLVADILAYEQKDRHGLNGFLLLLHVGSTRRDKVHPYIGTLIDALRRQGYAFVRIDEMLK